MIGDDAMRNAITGLFRRFENLIDPFAERPVEQLPETLLAFYWHFMRQVWPFFVALLAIGLVVALIEVSLFAFLGEIVDLVRTTPNPDAFFDEHGGTLLWMGFVALIARPIAFLVHDLLIHQTLTPTFVNMIRWQTHRYVLRQSMNFFQERLRRADHHQGRTKPRAHLRESAVQTTDAIWFMIIYITSAIALFSAADPQARLAAP